VSATPSRLNVGLALASLLVALMLWLHVKSEAALTVTRKVDFTLRYSGLDESKYIVKSIPQRVPVQVEGTAEELERFAALLPNNRVPEGSRSTSLIATVDLADAKPELSSYRVRLSRNAAIDRTGVTLRLLTDEVAVIIEEVVEREMDVTVDHYNVPPGLMLSSADVKPDRVRLRGPMGDIVKVAQVRALVDVSEAIGRGVTIRVDAMDRNGRVLDTVACLPPEVTVLPQLAKVPPTKTVLVSVRIADRSVPAPGFKVTELTVNPPTIKVSGDLNALASLRSIETTPIKLDGLAGSTVVRARLVVPNGLTADRTSVEVRLRIEPIPTIANPAVNPPSGGGAP